MPGRMSTARRRGSALTKGSKRCGLETRPQIERTVPGRNSERTAWWNHPAAPCRCGLWRIRGAQPSLLPLFRRASKIAASLTNLYTLLCVGQPHGDTDAGLDTHSTDIGRACRVESW